MRSVAGTGQAAVVDKKQVVAPVGEGSAAVGIVPAVESAPE